MDPRILERDLARWTGFRPAAPGAPFGLTDRSGLLALEARDRLRGIRDLAADALQLAAWVAEQPHRHAYLLVLKSDVSGPRLAGEWTRAARALRPDVARRLRLIVLDPKVQGFEDNQPWVRRIREGLNHRPAGAAPLPPASPMTPKIFEIQKVLLLHGLLGHRPTPIHRLIRESGSSYPMVVRTLRKLEEKKVLVRSSDRSVSLSRFPVEVWSELCAVSGPFRRTQGFADVTGKSEPRSLLRRLEKLRPAGVALGGVHAARHWDPHFNLHGVPRLDLSVHLPPGPGSLDFVRALDPALKPANREQAPLLVVHPLSRGESFFRDTGPGLPVADPVETLLDLLEMRLTEQADELVAALTGKPGA